MCGVDHRETRGHVLFFSILSKFYISFKVHENQSIVEEIPSMNIWADPYSILSADYTSSSPIFISRKVLQNYVCLNLLWTMTYVLKIKIRTTTVYIWDALRNLAPFVQLKNAKKTHGGVLLLVKLHASSIGVSYVFFKLCKWYWIAQSIAFVDLCTMIAEYYFNWSKFCNGENNKSDVESLTLINFKLFPLYGQLL